MMLQGLRPAPGFTVIELVVTMVILSVLAVMVGGFIRPTIDSYFAVQQRADLADQADLAIRRAIADVRSSVPNSLRVPNSQCFEMVPTVGGGRYRMGPDVTNDTPAGCTSGSSATCSAWVDPSGSTSVFDALNIVRQPPSAGDWVVVNNQNGDDVYNGNNRALVNGVSTPSSTQGVLRLTIAATQFPAGYADGRFQVIAAGEPTVFYVCSGADGTLDGNGNGRGTLYRLTRGFQPGYPSACPSVAGAAVAATNVKSCTFVYDANHGATQQSGFIWLDIELARAGEVAHLATGAHVANAP
ncbi:prepilin-type N-terminal cleavage/methylation domain-containing protein [uncultured Aquabacterium sp.]|uniref:prepilin-type N-terminal cleavage/methylation domain-containing protein n=1 Tax=uncultured Aquabacterium sp. TaxID=158753 RepID=UPI0030D4F43C